MSGENSLTSVVEAARGGDAGAWNSLVERYLPLVMSVAGKVPAQPGRERRRESDAVAAPGGAPGPDSRARAPEWIVTTTRNEAFRLLKSRNRTLPVDPLGDWGPTARTARARHAPAGSRAPPGAA